MASKNVLFNAILASGTQITDEHFEEREKTCEGCPHFKMLAVLNVMGCGICKCPLETKGKLWTYFSPKKMAITRAECPLGKWAEIDNNFKDNYDVSTHSK